ncbi:MAG: Sec-independent protein translocase protein TatB [Thermodesulfobacteriota bacterium]
MFGIGMPELLIILVIALVVLGPDKLPDLARAVGRGIGEFRKATRDLKGTFESDDELKKIKESLSQAKQEMGEIVREQSKNLDVDAVVKSLGEGTFFDQGGQTEAAEKKETGPVEKPPAIGSPPGGEVPPATGGEKSTSSPEESDEDKTGA